MHPAETNLSCKDMDGLLPLFVDGELDARQMRAVALHGGRCINCAEELRSLEGLHSLIQRTVSAEVDGIDFSYFWSELSDKLPARHQSWVAGVRQWWVERPALGWGPYVGLAAVATAAALAFLLVNSQPAPSTQPTVQQVASAAQEAPASIDSLGGEFSSVAVVNDLETQTAVLWVSDDKLVDEAEK